MSKNSKDAYGAAGNTSLLLFDPESLVLVTDPESPLYDPRVHLPLDEAMVKNIMHAGVLQPVVIVKNRDTGAVEVVAGRQRVKAAREANRRLLASGNTPLQVPAVRRSDKGGDLMGLMVSENEIREDDTPLGRAEKMVRLMERYGRSFEQVAIVFGCSVATVKNTLALLDATDGVREAVASGQITAGTARKLARMPGQKQAATLAAVKTATQGAKGHKRALAARVAVSGKKETKMRTRRAIEDEIKRADEAGLKSVAGALRWVLGQ